MVPGYIQVVFKVATLYCTVGGGGDTHNVGASGAHVKPSAGREDVVEARQEATDLSSRQ